MFTTNNIILSPLEEFGVTWYDVSYYFHINFSLNTIFSQLAIINLIYIIFLFPAYIYLKNTKLQALRTGASDAFLLFFESNVLGIRVFKLFPLFFSVFYFIFLSNISGLYHYGKPISGQIYLTLMLAMVLFMSLIFLGLLIYGFSFFTVFLPKNDLPIFLFYFIALIEFFSFIIRPFSLAIRLFANMLAGHMLMVLVGTFMVFLSGALFIFLPLGVLTSFIIVLLEFFVSLIQAYVFVTLFLIYLAQVYDIYSH